jgi:hypothetical protein
VGIARIGARDVGEGARRRGARHGSGARSFANRSRRTRAVFPMILCQESPSTDYQKRLIRIFRAFSYQQFMIPGTSWRPGTDRPSLLPRHFVAGINIKSMV